MPPCLQAVNNVKMRFISHILWYKIDEDLNVFPTYIIFIVILFVSFPICNFRSLLSDNLLAGGYSLHRNKCYMFLASVVTQFTQDLTVMQVTTWKHKILF